MTPDTTAKWWFAKDVAMHCGIQTNTVYDYRRRGVMPPPDRVLGRTMAWKPQTIITWHASRPRVGIGGRRRKEP